MYARNKIRPESHFAVVANGNHQKNFLALAKALADVATHKREDMARIKSDDRAQFNKVWEVLRSTLIPNDSMLYRTDLPDGQKEKKRAILS
jgi:ABC-type phosphate/phosphonate transport system substrate-binding protein